MEGSILINDLWSWNGFKGHDQGHHWIVRENPKRLALYVFYSFGLNVDF